MNAGVDHKAQVLSATDVVELIGQTVKLRRQGRSFVGLCPFHQEKTPSFHVHPDRQFFYCFGCKAHGNAIDFVMQRDRLEFIDALKLLAERANIELPRFRQGGESAGERQQILDALSAACAFYQKMLASPAGEVARNYLAKRSFDAESIKRFQLGMVPEGWDHLLNSEVGTKFSSEILLKAGLLKLHEQRNSYYDTFRQRLMFPIRDEQGRVIAFGGRVLPGSDDKAKYLNSPETPVFSKGRCAYGLDLARQRIVETRTVIVVEGYADVIGCHQFGVTNCVSVLGTALTPQHVTLLRRYADRIVLLFDPDQAGELAVDRAVELFLTQPIEVQIATLPEPIDPDEYLIEHGVEAFNEVIAHAQDALTHKWAMLQRQYRASDGDLTGQQKAVEQYLGTLAQARGSGPIDGLRWGAALTRVSRLTGIAVEELNRRFRLRRPAARRPAMAAEPESAVAPSSEGEPELSDNTEVARPAGAQVRAERHLLGCLLAQPRWWFEVQTQVSLEDFLDPGNRRLAEVYWDYQRNEGEPVFAEFLGFLEPLRLSERAILLVEEVESLSDFDGTLASALEFIRYAKERREAAKLGAQLRRSTDENEDSEAVDLLRKLSDAARRPDLRRGV